MIDNLWITNHPQNFWQCQSNFPVEIWKDAIAKSLPILGLPDAQKDIDNVLSLILGEGRFGEDHWNLGYLKKSYYLVKPIIPRSVSLILREIYSNRSKTQERWPIEHHYVDFLWEIIRQILIQSNQKELLFKGFWPDHNRFAFVLTHDIETAAGQEFVKTVADLEEELGFRSLFNFVPEKYEVNLKLMDNLRQRGFEVGVHGLKHNGKLFDSKSSFSQKAKRINHYLEEWNVTGFRSELTHRQPEWMQSLDIEYDLSFFDTDPFEPIPGGTMSIWPFFIGHFVELPYTLVQDYTLTSVLYERSPRIWLSKVDYIEKYHGMALVNTHPDYLQSKLTWDLYQNFLCEIKKREDYWHTLPCNVARWWKARCNSLSESPETVVHYSKVVLNEGNIKILL